MNDDSIITFGMYKGNKLANVPNDYLLYIYNKGWAKDDLKKYIKANMDSIDPKQEGVEL